MQILILRWFLKFVILSLYLYVYISGLYSFIFNVSWDAKHHVEHTIKFHSLNLLRTQKMQNLTFYFNLP